MKSINYSLGKGASIESKNLDEKIYPVTKETFTLPFMQEITNLLFNSKNARSNSHIFAVKDVAGSKHNANDLHFDVQRTLKYFIYLNDTTTDNGTFFCVPGSHKTAVLIRKKHGNTIGYENLSPTRELPVNDNEELEKCCNEIQVFFIRINDEIYEDTQHSAPENEYISEHVHLNNNIQPLIENSLKEKGINIISKYRSNIEWSNTTVQKLFEYDEKFGCYKMK